MSSECEIEVGYWPATVMQLLVLRKPTPSELKFLATTKTRERSRSQDQGKNGRTRQDQTWYLGKQRLEGEEEREENYERRCEEDKERGRQGERRDKRRIRIQVTTQREEPSERHEKVQTSKPPQEGPKAVVKATTRAQAGDFGGRRKMKPVTGDIF